MEFKDLLTILENYGIAGVIVVTSIFFTYLIFKSKWFSNLLGKTGDFLVDKFISMRASKSKVKNLNESDITNHDIFNYINFMIYSKVPTLRFSSDYRTVVFRKYLTIYLTSHKNKIKEFLERKDFETMDESQLWNSLLKLINSIIYDYELEMRSANIPNVIIEKMKVKNNDTLSLTIDLLENVCNSNFYDSEKNFLKIYTILNIVLSILENTVTASELICNSINGELKGLRYSENGIDHIET